MDRVLTLLNGPAVRLVGSGFNLDALPLTPVAFPADVAIAAVGVAAPCTDFNVMMARELWQVEVRVDGDVTPGVQPCIRCRRMICCGWMKAGGRRQGCATSAFGQQSPGTIGGRPDSFFIRALLRVDPKMCYCHFTCASLLRPDPRPCKGAIP